MKTILYIRSNEDYSSYQKQEKVNSPESLTFCMEQARIREKEIRRNRIKDGIRCKRMRRQG
jgi:hypothetical protein